MSTLGEWKDRAGGLFGPYAEDFIKIKIELLGEDEELGISEDKLLVMLGTIERNKTVFDGRPDPGNIK